MCHSIYNNLCIYNNQGAYAIDKNYNNYCLLDCY